MLKPNEHAPRALSQLANLPCDVAAGTATKDLFASMYADLQRVAAMHVRRNGGAQSLDATTLIHEAYLRMACRVDVIFSGRPQFLAYASRVMRSLVIASVRQQCAQKRGNQLEMPLQDDVTFAFLSQAAASLPNPREALADLGAIDAKLAELVALRIFGGFSWSEIAALWHVSERTVAREWRKARLLLKHALRPDGPGMDALTVG